MPASVNNDPITVQHLAESNSNETETNTTEVVTAPKDQFHSLKSPQSLMMILQNDQFHSLRNPQSLTMMTLAVAFIRRWYSRLA